MITKWHATLSEPDVAWTEKVFQKVFNGKPFDQVHSGLPCCLFHRLTPSFYRPFAERTTCDMHRHSAHDGGLCQGRDLRGAYT